jgi:uncharacterized protein with HEPN domain
MTYHDDSVYLRHILDAAQQIQVYLRGVDEAEFNQTPLLQDGVIRQLEIIGEATRHLSNTLRSQYAEIPWRDIAGMRDKLIHDYLGVDLSTVWLTATQDIPELEPKIRSILHDFGFDV